jgi:hypothetical protein
MGLYADLGLGRPPQCELLALNSMALSGGASASRDTDRCVPRCPAFSFNCAGSFREVAVPADGVAGQLDAVAMPRVFEQLATTVSC